MITNQRDEVNKLFTPSTAIQPDVFQLFSGRKEQIQAIRDAIFERGRHIVLYGERGVGKTSISNYMKATMQQDIFVISTFINDGTTFERIWKDIFTELKYSETRKGTGIAPDKAIVRNFAEQLPMENLSETDILNILQYITQPILIIIDEFDKINKKQIKEKMAHVIKLFSDKGINITLMLVGVADDIGTLIGGHESIKRNINEIKMPRMSETELRAILIDRFTKINLSIETIAENRIIQLSGGLPEYVHTLGKYSALHALESGRNNIINGDVTNGIRRYIKTAEQSLMNSYDKATSSNHTKAMHREVLLACSRAECDEMGYFTQKDVVEALSKIGKETNIASIGKNHIERLVKDKILLEVGESRRRRYRFVEPRLKIYVELMNQ